MLQKDLLCFVLGAVDTICILLDAKFTDEINTAKLDLSSSNRITVWLARGCTLHHTWGDCRGKWRFLRRQK
jgi:hypothetical protein